MNNVLATLTVELIRQGLDGKRWEACEGCPAENQHDPHTKGTLCHFLGIEANKVMGGFSSCGGGATWRIKKEAETKAEVGKSILPETFTKVQYVWIKETSQLAKCPGTACNFQRGCEHEQGCSFHKEAMKSMGFKHIRKSEMPSPSQLHKYYVVEDLTQ